MAALIQGVEMNENEKCENCRFWYKTNGPCRRFPPLANRAYPVEYHYPFTQPDDWCGEWQSKEKADKQAEFDAHVKRNITPKTP